MKKTLICSAILVSAIFSTTASAEEVKLNPWKHCGIGAMIFEDNGAAAAISNIIWDLGTTAVTSQVSSEDSCEGKPVQAAMFIQDNFNNVIEQTSQGSGEHLNAMLDILNVEPNKQANIIEHIRDGVAQDVTTDTATPESYYNVVMASL
jgi:hypothetical protein